jgi:hypothetical protein
MTFTLPPPENPLPHRQTHRPPQTRRAPARPTGYPDLSKLARSTEDALTGILWDDDAQITGYTTLTQTLRTPHPTSHNTPTPPTRPTPRPTPHPTPKKHPQSDSPKSAPRPRGKSGRGVAVRGYRGSASPGGDSRKSWLTPLLPPLDTALLQPCL